MARTNKVGELKTAIYQSDGYTVAQSHDTQIVRFNDDEIILNSGGWQTVTTKRRMNQVSDVFHLGFRVSQRQGEWFVDYFANEIGDTYSFNDGMILGRQSVETPERINANV
jgi:hypothetical protein